MVLERVLTCLVITIAVVYSAAGAAPCTRPVVPWQFCPGGPSDVFECTCAPGTPPLRARDIAITTNGDQYATCTRVRVPEGELDLRGAPRGGSPKERARFLDKALAANPWMRTRRELGVVHIADGGNGRPRTLITNDIRCVNPKTPMLVRRRHDHCIALPRTIDVGHLNIPSVPDEDATFYHSPLTWVFTARLCADEHALRIRTQTCPSAPTHTTVVVSPNNGYHALAKDGERLPAGDSAVLSDARAGATMTVAVAQPVAGLAYAGVQAPPRETTSVIVTITVTQSHACPDGPTAPPAYPRITPDRADNAPQPVFSF